MGILLMSQGPQKATTMPIGITNKHSTSKNWREGAIALTSFKKIYDFTSFS